MVSRLEIWLTLSLKNLKFVVAIRKLPIIKPAIVLIGGGGGGSSKQAPSPSYALPLSLCHKSNDVCYARPDFWQTEKHVTQL